MSLPAAALRRPVTTVAATLALVLVGSVSLGRLPTEIRRVPGVLALYASSAARDADLRQPGHR